MKLNIGCGEFYQHGWANADVVSFGPVKPDVLMEHTDEATIEAVRSVTGKPLRVDANEGWKDKETAIRKIEWLASKGVELVEQPMPAAMLEEAAWVRERSPIPVFADEACLRASSIPQLAGAYHGVNVKLDKAGGLREGLPSCPPVPAA